MGKANAPVHVSVRRHGFRQKVVARLMFEPGPAISGWVNYKNKVHPVFKDANGRLFLNEEGWVAARQQPLKGDRDHVRTGKPDDGFDF
jgi:hypothetical protein